jgi:putative spermidine/putrescine transport system permease protein
MAAPPYATPLQRAWYYGFRLLCAAVFFFLVAPILIVIPLSFNSEPFFTFPMPGLSLKWYAEFFNGLQWQLALKNSAVTAVSATALATLLGTLAALGMSRARFPLQTVVLTILISPLVVPIVIVAVGLFYFFARVGLAGPEWGLVPLILAHTVLAVPFVVITVTATLVGFDHNLARAGSSLGAGPAEVFFRVTLPLILPGVVSGALFAFATSWDEVVVALFLTGASEHTLPRRMWSGIRELLNPTILSVATLLVTLSIVLMIVVELLRRRAERLRGIRP